MDVQMVIDLLRLSNGQPGPIDLELFFRLHPQTSDVKKALRTLGNADLLSVCWNGSEVVMVCVNPSGIAFAQRYGIFDEA